MRLEYSSDIAEPLPLHFTVPSIGIATWDSQVLFYLQLISLELIRSYVSHSATAVHSLCFFLLHALLLHDVSPQLDREYMHFYSVVHTITENRAGIQCAFNWICFQAYSNRASNIWDHKVELFCCSQVAIYITGVSRLFISQKQHLKHDMIPFQSP